MPRVARKKHDQAVYHIMVRGNNKQNIFFNDDDRRRYLQTLKRYKERYQIKIYAYCLMDNHIHMIIDSNGQDISKVMKSISLSYVQYINRTHSRSGHLFQDRFKSEIIDSDAYIIQASKYIHLNPVRANMVKNPSQYEWSSFNIYAGKNDIYQIVDEEFILQYFSNKKIEAREFYVDYVDENSEMFISQIEENKYENSDRKIEVRGSSINSVIKKVAICFGISTDEVTLKYNKRNTNEKKLALYLISLKSKLPYKDIGKKFGICGSAVGQNIKKAVELVMNNVEMRRYFELILQS